MPGFWQRPWIRWTSLILALALMAGIFVFSSQGRESETTSESFAFIIIDTIHPEYENLDSSAQFSIWQTAQRIVRKLAHVFEYAVLGFLLCLAVESWFGPQKRKKHKWIAFAIGALYAVSDEVHQYFVPGRSCEVADVLIDSLGVFLGVLLAVKIIKTYPREKDDTLMEPWTKKTLAKNLGLAVLIGALLTVCLQLGLSYIRPNAVGSIPKHLIIFAAMAAVMIVAVLLCGYTRPIRKLWDNINQHILDPETRKPILDILYAILAITMLLHHFYVILYYPTIPAGATKLAPIWMILAALTVLMGRTWRGKGFLFASLMLIYAFERTYLKNLTISGETGVYFFSAIYSMFFAAGVFAAVKPNYQKTLLQVLCALWSLGTLGLCVVGLYTAWTGNQIHNFGGGIALLERWEKRLYIFSIPTVAAAYTGCGALVALVGFSISKHKLTKAGYLLICLITMITTPLTDSRSSTIMISFMIAGTICLAVWTILFKYAENKQIKKRIPLITIVLITCLILCFTGSLISQRFLAREYISIRDRGGLITSTALAEDSIVADPIPTPTSPPGFRQRELLALDGEELNSPLSGRLTIWQNVFKYIIKQPQTMLYGLSIDGSVAAAVNREDHVHNILLQTLLEGGIPSLLLYLSMLIYFFYHTCRLWKRWRLPLWQRMLPLPVLSVCLLEMAECLSHFSYGHPPMTVFWFFLGCTVAVSKSIKDTESKKAISD